MGRLIRTLIENAEFSKQCAALSDVHRIDQALEAFYWALSRHAEAYPVLSGFDKLRLVTTDRITGPEGTIPRLRLYYKILNKDEVELLWIEVDPKEDPYEGF